MPTRALTVTLNHDHNKKFVFLLPESSLQPKEVILREAQNKFRIKGLKLVYLQGGAHVGDVNLPASVTEVWVSKGEVYNGPPIDQTRTTHLSEIRMISEKSFVDDKAIQQLRFVAGLQDVRLAVGMPDLHPGNRFPIGCAIAVEGVYPALIGSDIGCGIALYHLSASKSHRAPSKLASLLQGLDDPWPGDVSLWLAKYGIHRSSEFDTSSLGTVGAGNHFAEICNVERIVDSAAATSIRIYEESLYLLVHTGSRGLGASILASQTRSGNSNPYIPHGSSELAVYLTDHDYAIRWAVANRDLVAHRIMNCVFDSENNPENSSNTGNLEKLLDVTHNSVTNHALNINGETKELWIHRKGAAPADQGIVPCPGSRGDFSWLLQPLGDGHLNAHSLAHGAGRRFGRNALHKDAKTSKSSLTTTSLGSEVVCTDPELLVEERPEAYKDVGCVVEDMEKAGVCTAVAVLRPVVTYKIRERREGRK